MRIVIVGTGTEIGKTHLGVALVTALVRQGQSVVGLKPVESGVEPGEMGADARALEAAGKSHVTRPQPYALVDAVSPHLAARREGVAIELEKIRQWVDAHHADWTIIETAGALLSPLGPSLTNLDLALSLKPDVWILVAPDRLGVLHEVAACHVVLRTLASPGLSPLVALQAPSTPDSSTGTNAEELRVLKIAGSVFTIPRGAPDSPACQVAVSSLLAAAEHRSRRL